MIQAIEKHLQKASEIEAAYLFGSQTKAETHATSDYDIGLVFKTHANDRLAAQIRIDQIQLKLEKQTDAQLDLIDLEYAPLPLQFNIIQGKLLFTQDPTRLHRLENAILSKMEIDY